VSEAQTSAGIISATAGAHVMIRVILLIIYLGSILMIKNKAGGTLYDDQKQEYNRPNFSVHKQLLYKTELLD